MVKKIIDTPQGPMSYYEIAKIVKCAPETIQARHLKGWTGERLFEPVHTRDQIARKGRLKSKWNNKFLFKK